MYIIPFMRNCMHFHFRVLIFINIWCKMTRVPDINAIRRKAGVWFWPEHLQRDSRLRVGSDPSQFDGQETDGLLLHKV